MVNLQQIPLLQLQRTILLAALLLLSLAVYAQAQSADRKILVIGDSISAGYGIEAGDGWVNLLQQRLQLEFPGWRVINASISGDTTTGGRERLPLLLNFHDPDIVVIELGGNDGLRGQPVQSIRDNLAAMIGMARDHGARVVLLGMHIPPNYGRQYTVQFHDSFGVVAAAFDVPVLDFLLDGIATNPDLMQADRIHPTAAAQPLILRNVMPILAPLLDD